MSRSMLSMKRKYNSLTFKVWPPSLVVIQDARRPILTVVSPLDAPLLVWIDKVMIGNNDCQICFCETIALQILPSLRVSLQRWIR